jgi:hypothetical protein
VIETERKSLKIGNATEIGTRTEIETEIGIKTEIETETETGIEIGNVAETEIENAIETGTGIRNGKEIAIGEIVSETGKEIGIESEIGTDGTGETAACQHVANDGIEAAAGDAAEARDAHVEFWWRLLYRKSKIPLFSSIP